jgi:hypothetical protein
MSRARRIEDRSSGQFIWQVVEDNKAAVKKFLSSAHGTNLLDPSSLRLEVIEYCRVLSGSTQRNSGREISSVTVTFVTAMSNPTWKLIFQHSRY